MSADFQLILSIYSFLATFFLHLHFISFTYYLI